MPSGKTHDRITLWGLPLITGITFAQTRSSNLTLIVSGAFLFSGLMFGPDLDLYSVQFKRWGYLRWIWIPYQKTLRHRSLLSHGVIIGTTLRVLYLSCWLAVISICILGIVQVFWGINYTQQLWALLLRALQYPNGWIALLLGLEIGAVSHIVSDWCGSAYKRAARQSHGKMKKSKSTKSVNKNRRK